MNGCATRQARYRVSIDIGVSRLQESKRLEITGVWRLAPLNLQPVGGMRWQWQARCQRSKQ